MFEEEARIRKRIANIARRNFPFSMQNYTPWKMLFIREITLRSWSGLVSFCLFALDDPWNEANKKRIFPFLSLNDFWEQFYWSKRVFFLLLAKETLMRTRTQAERQSHIRSLGGTEFPVMLFLNRWFVKGKPRVQPLSALDSFIRLA